MRPTHAVAGPTTRRVIGPAGVGSEPDRNDEGFSLVEVIVSIALLVIVATAAAVALTTSIRYAENNEDRVVAAGLATAQIEQARSAPNPAGLVGGTTSVSRNGTPFSIVRQLSPITGCTVALTRTITITVSWPGHGGPVRSDTVRAC
jgi:prepilin-type N-terminal cleavage/methylation domain-containing protein